MLRDTRTKRIALLLFAFGVLVSCASLATKGWTAIHLALEKLGQPSRGSTEALAKVRNVWTDVGANPLAGLVDRERGIVVGWSARAACTFAVSVFLQSIGELDAARRFHPFVHEYRMKVLGPRRFAASARDLAAAAFSVKFVRGPFSRAASSYSHQSEHDFFGAAAVRARLNASGLRGGDTSFLKWLEAVDAVGLAATDIHTRLQVSDAELEGLAYDLVCRVDGPDLDACLSAAAARSGADFRVVNDSAASHAHLHANYAPDADVAAWPRARFHDAHHRSVLPEAAAFYRGPAGRRAADLVRRLYARDFRAYGYDPDAPP